MALSKQKSRFRNALWGLVREVGESNVEIMRDPMSHRYEVGRHAAQFEADTAEIAQDTYDRLLALLSIHGWTVKKTSGNLTKLTSEQFPDVGGHIEEPYDAHTKHVVKVHISARR